MSNIIHDYKIEEIRENMTLGDLTDKLLEFYYMIPESQKTYYDHEAKKIIESYAFLLKRLGRSEAERFSI